ncbi:MAG: nitrate reductase cytochrome c-type subunit [Sulfurovum sp.]|nr:nitrate reductase cytochrome c-type subunit [Sulfurovum sp.]
MEAIADQIKNAPKAPSAFEKEAKTDETKLVNINAVASDPKKIAAEDLGTKKEVSEEALGLRKVDLYSEDSVTPEPTDYDRPAPGSATKFERAYVNAPPMIPHSVDGLLPITKDNNQCLGCHMPEQAKAMGATPIPPSHFTNFRPETVLKNGELVKEGKVVGLKGDLGNTSDIKIAKAKKMDHLYQGRFNCTQCHAPQAKVDPVVGNTFTPDVPDKKLLGSSNLMDTMNEGVE